MSAIKINDCKKNYFNIGLNLDLDETHLCAGGEPGKCSSAGDGGGGLFSKLSDGRWQVVGVSSAGATRCSDEEGRPDVYTRVSQYVEWIEQTMCIMSAYYVGCR